MTALLLIISSGAVCVHAQQEIGFIERFALAEDRREALSELIPGTDDYFYFHCLHYQNTGQLAQAEALLNEWRAKHGDNERVKNMTSRQILLAYDENPKRALDYLQSELRLNLNHAPPSKDQAAELPSSLDEQQISTSRLLAAAIRNDQSLSQIETDGLHLLMDQRLSDLQWRTVIGRLDRADLPGLVVKIADELALKDSRGFGWASVHSLLSLAQLEELARLRPNLLEQSQFVKAFAARLAPAASESLSDKQVLREYLNRLRTWTNKLPASQNNLKSLVIGNLLKLDVAERRFDRTLFIDYLELPRSTPYYNTARVRRQRAAPIQPNFSLQPLVPLPPVGDDQYLIRRYLEHFFVADANVNEFAEFLDREYLERVFAETKILYGVGEAKQWYSKLRPENQQALRERTEIRFAPHNPTSLPANADVQLDVELKNIDELVVRIYEINTKSYYRFHDKAIGTDIDLDGLVANVERKFEYSLPAERRHGETLDFPELKGRGVWVIDLLGGGQRSRALVRKGDLVALERLGDAGHVFQVVNESGQQIPDAKIEFGGRSFSGENGRIVVPYAEATRSRSILLVDGDFAAQTKIQHRSESYSLAADFLLDRQALVSNAQATITIRAQLTCNGQLVSNQLLDDVQLSIAATDADGISTSQTVGNLTPTDGTELTHTFLVPQRLKNLAFTLSGTIINESKAARQSVTATHTIACNGIAATDQIGDFYLRRSNQGFQLHALGRNGEPISSLPVSLQLKVRHFNNNQSFTLATQEDGSCQLGTLENVESLTVSAQGMQPVALTPNAFHRNWPAVVHLDSKTPLTLPLGSDTAEARSFSLYETRIGLHHRELSDDLRLDSGSLTVAGLTPGDYTLTDHLSGQKVLIRVDSGARIDQFLVGKHRVLQADERLPIIIREAKIVDDELVIKLDGADQATRFHVLANVFLPSRSRGTPLSLPTPQPNSHGRLLLQNYFVDSLRLDEEYSYILNRQGSKKYPGNLLPQPTLLVNPWEVSVTENQNRRAEAGDAIPASPAEMAADGERQNSLKRRQLGASPDWKCFDFLSANTSVVNNLTVENGIARVPLKALAGFSDLTVIAVNLTGSDARTITLPQTALPVQDRRLESSFPAKSHLAQSQRVEFLSAGETKNLGDPETRRVQVYTSIADVFQLYSTLVNDESLEKFRFVGNWHELTDQEKQTKYNEFACHELHFFLYHKDPQFFQSVVKPLISSKLDKQLLDLWLTDQPLSEFDQLWRVQRLNALERILLAQRIKERNSGTKRWFHDVLDALPPSTELRERRFGFALNGSALAPILSKQAATRFMSEAELDFASPVVGGRARPERLSKSLEEGVVSETAEEKGLFFAPTDRGAAGGYGGGRQALFESLDKTREWAESNYYQVRLSGQTAALIKPNAFWQQFLESGAQPFLPRSLDVPANSLSEALFALAVIDLPFEAKSPSLTVNDGQLIVESETQSVIYLESIESAGEAEQEFQDSILVGQDIYLARANTAEEKNRPVAQDALLRGIPYRVNVVVTNPTSLKQRVQVLTQLPAGTLPLAGSKRTRSTSVELNPYSTAQVSYQFYFPESGDFEHYGAQVSRETQHTANTESSQLRVLDEPEVVDENTWSYVADWGTNEQVIEFLKRANLQQIDLARIAFRMKDETFYNQVTEFLSPITAFDSSLWSFAVLHNDPAGIKQLLHSRRDFVSRLGVHFVSPLIEVLPTEQLSYEHLDYKPLVLARIHQLGPKPLILNASQHRQYHRLLDVLAHQNEIDNAQRLQVCYYLVLQNRITEAMQWFESADPNKLPAALQYDYLSAFLDFYRGEYERAASIAARYAQHPVPRWSALFKAIRDQVTERDALLAGRNEAIVPRGAPEQDGKQRILIDDRGDRMSANAKASPSLTLNTSDGMLILEHANLERIQVNYYLMDIELLFSRQPFVSQADGKPPVIQPNFSDTIVVGLDQGTRRIELPGQLQNRNLVAEVTAEGISRSQVLTANALSVSVSESFGRLQVLKEQGRRPIEAAYVKVYAKHNDGSIRFFKDGYTDLRGQFDYATLSTNELDTVQKFSILVLDDELGAVVQEVGLPAR